MKRSQYGLLNLRPLRFSRIADDFLLASAQRACVQLTFETVLGHKVARMLVCPVPRAEIEPFGDAIVANGIGRQPYNQSSDALSYCHGDFPVDARLCSNRFWHKEPAESIFQAGPFSVALPVGYEVVQDTELDCEVTPLALAG